MWVWEWDYNPTSALYGSLMRRPDAISQLSKISLDLMRLSYEVVALQDDEPEVALLYSDASRVYSDTYAIGCYAAYESLRYAGKSVQFITETGVDVPTKLANCTLLVIPETMQIKEDMPEKIAEFMKKGGKVILFNQNSLCNNEYNKPLTGSAKEASDYIRQNATIVEKGKQETDSLGDWSFEDCHNYFKDYLRSNGMDYIRLIDAKTGEDIDYVETNTAIYNGKLLVNLNNLREDAEVKLIVDGNVVENSKELRCGESFGETFALKKYKPILLSIDVRNLFIDTYNHWAEETISKLADEGVVKGVSAGRFVPEKAISRVEFATLLSRAFQLNVDPSTGYANWYDGVVREANANGIELGELSAPLNREDAAELVASYYEKFVSPIDASPTSYLDRERFDHSVAIDKASNLGAMQGYPDGDFRPEKLLTRAEATVIIERVLERTK